MAFYLFSYHATFDAEKWLEMKNVKQPYDRVIRMEGNAVELSPFRFSSEYSDDDVGLVCYNYHYFNPMDGRWISRYPIQESDS